MIALLAVVLCADETNDALAVIHRMADALSANNPSEAIAQFDPACPDYDKLKQDFIGLSNAYNVTNEATVTDEQDTPGVVKLTLEWTITLNQPDSSLSKRRTSEVRVLVVRKKGKWKIVSFSPAGIFNPAISNP